MNLGSALSLQTCFKICYPGVYNRQLNVFLKFFFNESRTMIFSCLNIRVHWGLYFWWTVVPFDIFSRFNIAIIPNSLPSFCNKMNTLLLLFNSNTCHIKISSYLKFQYPHDIFGSMNFTYSLEKKILSIKTKKKKKKQFGIL